MAFIKIVNEYEAEGELKSVYDEIIKGRGKLSNIMKIHSLNPDTMVKHMALYKTLMFSKSGLSRELKETIAIVVSKTNNCDYCVNHHAEALLFYWKDSEKIKLFIEDFKKYGTKRYKPVEYPVSDFIDNQFTISLVSHFLFLYEDHINYDLHKKIILELLRITSKEIRIFPIVNLKGEKSSLVDTLMHDKDFERNQISVKKVDYEFMKNGNEMMAITH